MDINDVCSCVENWYYLKEAHFTGNPISKAHRYREDIIGSSVRLGIYAPINLTIFVSIK